jgi:processing peptidase subunit alpha
MLTGNVRRKAAPSLATQVRNLSTTGSLQQALPATKEVADKSAGFLSKLFGGASSRETTPLDEALTGYPQPSHVAPPSSPPKTETTTLSNGVKIISEATYGPTATVGVYVDSGSVYETPETTGASHLLEYLAFKSTTNRTSFRIQRELEGLGANVVASASREQMVYSADVVRSNTAEAVEVLADSVLNPKFNRWEVEEQVAKLKGDLKKFAGNHQNVITEGLHAVGYQGPLARPLVCPEDAVGGLSADMLNDFVTRNYTAGRIVVSGAGIEHRELVSLAEPLFSGLPSSGAGQQAASKYLGGDFRQFRAEPLTHSAIAFELPGGWRDLKGSVAVTVMQFLLGGGGAFSSGGPGKGMHSQLYRNVLNAYSWMQNCVAFNTLYNDTGLVGIIAAANSQHAGQSVDVLCREMQALTKEVKKEDLERAKNAAICQVLVNLESRAVVSEDIGRQALTYGHRKPVKEFIDVIKAVQPADISKLVTQLFKSPLTYGAVGDIANMPRYEEVAQRFK